MVNEGGKQFCDLGNMLRCAHNLTTRDYCRFLVHRLLYFMCSFYGCITLHRVTRKYTIFHRTVQLFFR